VVGTGADTVPGRRGRSWATLASGSLLAAFDGSEAGAVSAPLGEAGYEVAVIADAEPGHEVIDSVGEPINWPKRDELNRIAG
jgi:hypothetical protein